MTLQACFQSRFALLAMATFVSLSVSAAGNPVAGEQKVATCIACHGQDGNSQADMWPKLAGQLPDYIIKQLRDFKAGKRQDEQMSPQATNLAEADMPDIAAYFASKSVKSGVGNKELLATGEQIYLHGKGRPSPVTACIGCHGPGGSGNRDWDKTWSQVPAILAPAIGGQHASYIDKQLKAYRDGKRSNDAARVMRDIAGRLNDAEIAALAAYVTTLKR